jgi:RNA polymerase sigma-70 factor, ECF subfamily
VDHLRAVSSGTPSEGVPEGQALAELLKRSARGDRDAFASLYDATSARAFGLAVRVVRDPAQAEEVTQDAFLDVWRSASRYDQGRGSVIGWLLTIVHRKAVDRVRAAEAASRRDSNYHHDNRSVDHDATAEAAESSMEARRVRSVLDQLTAVQREALELAYFGGYTHTEVATMLDLPVGTAKTRIRDGLIRMRDAMGVTTQ